jgi:hypothetical protein
VVAKAPPIPAEWEKARAEHRAEGALQSFRVIGRHEIKGVKTGGTVQLTDSEALTLLAGGHVESVKSVRQNKSAAEAGHSPTQEKE